MKTALFDYDLPKKFIAQHPVPARDRSKLFVLDRQSGSIEHRTFCDLIEYVTLGDVLVVNDTCVLHARLRGHRATGGAVEVLLVRPVPGSPGGWETMLNCRGRLRDGEEIRFSHELSAVLLGRAPGGASQVELRCDGDLDAVLDRIGRAPLPPYIRRSKELDPYTEEDFDRYQTVYAKHPGAVAAPTAGLHFTHELLQKIQSAGCTLAHITLHVGPGTFKPVRVENIEDHVVDPECYAVTQDAADVINAASRVIAVGTTTCRVLESFAGKGEGSITPGRGWTDLFIRPPHEFQAVDRLVTNFHLPRSSLLMLVSAFAGREAILAAYEEAKRKDYRFYSYGDAMLII